MGKITLYHGSSDVILRPEYGRGKRYNDYGLGFYCTGEVELAREWACTETAGGYVNQYELETGGLSFLHLEHEPYTILHWLTGLEMRIRRFFSRTVSQWRMV